MTAIKARRVRANPDERRAQLLDEAMRLIGQRGYHGFGIRELAKRCGLSDAGLLYYFGTKEKLLIALLKELDRRDSEIVAAKLGLVHGKVTQTVFSLTEVLTAFRVIVAHLITQPELLRLHLVVQAEAMNATHPAHAFCCAREAATIAAFVRMLAPHSPEPASIARQLLATMDGLGQQWLRSNHRLDFAGEWDRVLARLLIAPSGAMESK